MRLECHLFGISILFVLVGVIGCQDRREKATADPLFEAIELPEIDLPEESAEPPQRLDAGDGLWAMRYTVPPSFLSSAPAADPNGAASDPFAPAASSGPVRKTAKQVLQEYGVVFPEGAEAVYDPRTGTLKVTAPPDQLDLVDVIMNSILASAERQINFRVEIFELPAKLALKLQQKTGSRDDHRPEWEAVLRLLEKGGARFVTSAELQARSGQRAKFEDVRERIYPKYDWVNSEKKAHMAVEFDTRKVGTILEADPVLGMDSATIDLNLDFEHHTAPPTEKFDQVRFPNAAEDAEVSVPEFHVKKITTQLTILRGQVRLLGAWRPTGKPEYDRADVMQIAFLKADIQLVGRAGRIR